jgi:DNA-binding FrmR family transcriptional regulator
VLRETRDLELAHETAGGKRERLLRRLSNARGSMRGAREDIDEWADDEEVIALVDACEEELKALREAL